MDEKEILTWIQQLTEKQLVEFLYKAFENQRTRTDEFASHWVLFEAQKDVDDPDWTLISLCPYDKQRYPGGWVDDAPLCQSGGCCGFETLSIAKHAICPICKGSVYGT